MRPRRIRIGDEPLERAFGSILAADARGGDGHPALRKGTRLGEEHRAALETLRGAELHLVRLDEGELAQDEVARRLARVLAGPGTAPEEPSQGQARVRATRRGLLRVRVEAIAGINASPPLLCFTRAQGQVVLEGDEVAGAKSASLATPERLLRDAEDAARAAPVVAVAPFEPRRVGVVMTDRLPAAGRALMADAIRRKIAWFGSELVALRETVHETSPIERELDACLDAGAELLLLSGANSLDPLDAALEAVSASGGRVERSGVPAHPGSMVWVGSLREATLLGIATCAGFGKNTALDLLLARVLAGENALAAADALGAGGLVEGATAIASFPPYDRAGGERWIRD